MINFLHSELKPSVVSSCVCEDNYEATNLISSDHKKLAHGFMAFSVTKPPINLTFNFTNAIEIHKIKIWSSLGALKSTGFEIKIKNDDDMDYLKIAHVSNLMTDDIVTFCRNLTSSLDKQIQFFNYKLAHDILNKTTSFMVTIKSTRKCPPVIRKIEVWGLPARSVSKGIKENIHRIWDEILFPRGTKEEKIKKINIQKNISASSLIDYQNIPSEFLDEITCEIMTFPMTLPSGKLVDQSTIDKHSLIEEKWGRVPSDPFTGRSFTYDRKPILNLPIKARIEKFLLENSNSQTVKDLPRTLGRNPNNKRKIETFIPVSNSGNYNTSSNFNIEIEDCNNAQEINYKKPKMDFLSTTNVSIEDDIRAALKNITRYSQRSTFNATIIDECIRCKNSGDNMYKITTCNHLVCKICLDELCQSKICTCGILFRNSDVGKFNK